MVPNVCLSLESRPENVLIVRQVLSGVAEAANINALELNDISSAVSEACNNIVQHAYGYGSGPMEVEVQLRGQGLRVIVRDHGSGIQPHLDSATEDTGGIGIPLMLALATRAAFKDLDGGGTEVRLDFASPDAHEPALDGGGAGWTRSTRTLRAGSIELELAPPSLVRTVMPRVVCALAARARFSTDALAGVQQLASSLANHTGGVVDASHLRLGISPGEGALDMRLWPLVAGHSLDGVADVLDRLAEQYSVTLDGSAEVLDVRLTARR